MALTLSQVERFQTEGYLVVEDALQPDDLNPILQAYEEEIDRRAVRFHAEGKSPHLYQDQPFSHRLARLAEHCPEIAGGIDIYEARLRPMFEFLANPRLLDIVESLVGPEILCNPTQHIRAKMPDKLGTSLHRVPWHQDMGVLLPEADGAFILSIWIPLVDATVENGCLEVLPGSHKTRMLLTHEPSAHGLQVVPAEMPASEGQAIPLKAGGLILFNNYTLHRSTPNLTDGIRWSLDLRYQPIGVPTGRPAYPAHVVRSRKQPDLAERDYAHWAVAWEHALANAAGARFYRWTSDGSFVVPAEKKRMDVKPRRTRRARS
ncbi:MAG: phytanoyl-CoA dioxygenase family protein [Candidatus Latescibacteria bacterium]|nr:phytanoyl-CoA dioxygenase family protein [Candidatus Latescibacterota bacterium]